MTFYLNVKFRWEKGIFEENVFSNICSTHKNAPKKYPTILKFEKKKNMTCPNIHADTIDQGEVAKGKYTGTKEPYRKSVLLVN